MIFTDFDFWILDFLVLFYFIFLFRFSSLFFNYLWDNYRTLLATVLFIRTARLSCINIRVIIIIIIIISHFSILKSRLMRPPGYYDQDFMTQQWSH